MCSALLRHAFEKYVRGEDQENRLEKGVGMRIKAFTVFV